MKIFKKIVRICGRKLGDRGLLSSAIYTIF